jgi:hypothetical protein
MKKLIIVVLAVPAILFVVIPAIMIFDVLNDKQKQTVHYGNNDFIMTSWGEFAHSQGYRLYHVDNGKKKLVIEGSGSNSAIVEFSVQWETNGIYFARFMDAYIRIDNQEINVFDWQLSKQQFMDYFHWILQSQGFWECHSVAGGMHHWWDDPQAKEFLEKVLAENPDSDFFPQKTVGDIWLRNYKQTLSEQLNKNPNQKLDPTVKTPAESGNEQGTAGQL